VTVVIAQASIARALEDELQRCCLWALAEVPSDIDAGQDNDDDDDNGDADGDSGGRS
jgi:hypothetical protein